jgi:hypothetical protein
LQQNWGKQRNNLKRQLIPWTVSINMNLVNTQFPGRQVVLTTENFIVK